MKELFIICNSPQALAEISEGNFEGLHTKDIFTCNSAHTFFRTSGRHLNFFTDHFDIMRHLVWPEKLSDNYHLKIKHVFSMFTMKLANGTVPYIQLNYSPIEHGCSTAIGALAYACFLQEWDEIYLIGYTLSERNNPVWENILKEYNRRELRDSVFLFSRMPPRG